MLRIRRRFVVLAILLIVVVLGVAVFSTLLICACTLPPTPLAPTNEAITADNAHDETREILFTSNRDGDWDIYVMALSDHSVKNLTNNTFDDGFGSYSADGGAITFLSNRSGKLDAYMMNADGSDQRVVASDLATIFSVISSGRLNWGLVNDSYERRERSVFVSLRDLNLEVYTQDASGEHNLSKNGAIDWFPAWNDDGSRIAFASDREGANQEVYVMDADGGNVRRLTDAPGDDLYPMWWGNTLYFFSDRDIPFAEGKIGLYSVNMEDENPQVQRVQAGDPAIPTLGAQFWRESGSQIYMSNAGGDWDIYYADSVGRNVIPLTDNDADDLFPVWRPEQKAT